LAAQMMTIQIQKPLGGTTKNQRGIFTAPRMGLAMSEFVFF
jgi:hypothetical protein